MKQKFFKRIFIISLAICLCLFIFVLKSGKSHLQNYLLIVITSSPQNSEMRRVIRRTWGNHENYAYPVQIIFSIGRDEKHETQIFEEIQREKDILYLDDLDESYGNLSLKLYWTYKHILGFPAEFVVKSDDDVFLNVENLVKKLMSLEGDNFVLCKKISKTKPLRNTKYKWFISLEDYPEKMYPDYCQGSAYAMPMKTLSQLITGCESQPWIKFEDVYITGVCRQNTKIEITHDSGFNALKVKNFCRYNDIISSHYMKKKEIQLVWDYFYNKVNPKCVD